MFARPFFLLKYWVLWLLFFELARFAFLLSNFTQVKTSGLKLSAGSLFYGLRMDISMATYILLPVVLFSMLSVFVKQFRSAAIYIGYTALVLFFILLAVFADIGLFKAWGSRLDDTPFKYLSNPKEVWASIAHLPILLILLGFLILYIGFYLLFRKYILKFIAGIQSGEKRILSLFSIIVLAALLIIPLRGGLQLAPLNQSSVYFSQDNFANMAAINAPWNMLYALNHSAKKENPFKVTDEKIATLVVDSLFQSAGLCGKFIDLQKNSQPNIIVIAWESLTSKVVGMQKDGIPVMPGIDSLIKEGIYFSNIYASGDRTDKGIVAILSGYPAQPTTSIVKIPGKAAKLPMLSKVFRDSGYATGFYYGGEMEFANMKAYLLQGAFDKFISVNDFEKKDQNSKWGAHDDVVMQKFLKDLSGVKQPFFQTWLTLSSHEPYEIPVQPAFKGKGDVSQFLSSLHYSDSVVFRFIAESKKQSWWNNTLIVIVADHGHRLMGTGKKWDDFRIPLLFLGGVIKQPALFSEVGSQTDLAATLLGQLGYVSTDFQWSKNLMDTTAKKWAYFSFNNGFGYVEPGKKLVFDNVGKIFIEKEGEVTTAEMNRGRLLQQLSFQDYLDK